MKRDDLMENISNIPLEGITKVIDVSDDLLQRLRGVGCKTIGDLQEFDVNEVRVPYFPSKRVTKVLTEFDNLSEESLSDILFWNSKVVLPLQYDSNDPIEKSLLSVQEGLIEYIDGCYKRVHQLTNEHQQQRIKNLHIIIRGIYSENKSREDVAKEIKKDVERVRQVLLVELLYPIFEGREAAGGVLSNLSIDPNFVNKVQDYRKKILFDRYKVPENCPLRFFEDVLRVDVLQYGTFAYLVPSRQKRCYEFVLKAFFSEMSAIMVPTGAEELVSIIDRSDIVQREVYNNNKKYEEEFLYQLLYNDELTEVSESGILLKWQHIKTFGTGELDSVIQERALARIIADARESVTKQKVIEEYFQRYGIRLPDNLTLTATKKFGIRAQGHTHWIYSTEEVVGIKEWVQWYAQNIGGPFTMKDILAELRTTNYSLNSENTLRTYITEHCAVHCRRRNMFCPRHLVDSQDEPAVWRQRIMSGYLHWMANEIQYALSSRNLDSLNCNELGELLYERARGGRFTGNDKTAADYKYDAYLYFQNGVENAPFEIECIDRGNWNIKKRSGVYETTDWASYGLRGREYQRKMLAEATNKVRQASNGMMPLVDVVRYLCDVISGDNYEEAEVLTEGRVRNKLIEFINNREIEHPLEIIKINGTLNVRVVARLVNIQGRYNPSDQFVQIEYKTISQLAQLDWDSLTKIAYVELAPFCKRWFEEDGLEANRYTEIFDSFVNFLQTDRNENLSNVVPQRLYEFFVVSNPTSVDRYCIMCNIAKNFEALCTSIYRRRMRGGNVDTRGLYEKCQTFGMDDFEKILCRNTPRAELDVNSYGYALKTLSWVRNSDAHGAWFIDREALANMSEDSQYVQNILSFAALFIFTYAKYGGGI